MSAEEYFAKKYGVPGLSVEEGLDAGSRKDPDTHARNLELAADVNIPVDTVERNRPEVERMSMLKKTDIKTLKTTNPVLAEWLKDRDNAAVSHDDLYNLSGMENELSQRGIIENTLRNYGAQSNDALGNLAKMIAGIARDLEGVPMAHPILQGMRLMEPTYQALGERLEGQAESFDYIPEYTIEKLLDSPTMANISGMILEQGVGSIPYMVEAGISPAALIASIGQSIAEERAVNDGLDEPGTKERAIGLAVAAPVSLLERFGLARLLGPTAVASVRQVPGMMLRAGVQEGAQEFVQESAESAGGTVGTEAGFDAWTTFKSGLSGAITGAGVGATMRAAATPEMIKANRIARDTQERIESTQEQLSLDNLITYAQDSNTNSRAAERLKAFLQKTTDTSVYIAPEAFDNVEAVPDYIAEQIDGTGGDIMISMEQFLTETVKDETLMEAVRPHVRKTIEALSQHELDQESSTTRKLVEDAQANIETMTEANQIWDEVTEQLVSTGRMSETSARISATIYPAIASRVAQEHGMTVREAYERLGVTTLGPSDPVPEAISGIAPDAGPTLQQEQTFGDVTLDDELTVTETGEQVQVSRPAQRVWDQTQKRRGVVDKLGDCLNG